MDLTNAFGAEFREVREAEHRGQPVRVVSGARLYETDADDLWEALTNPERVARWFLPLTGDLKPGGRYQLEGNAGGEIIRCDPPEALDVTWEFAGSVSWVTLRLAQEGDSTRLTLDHLIAKDDKSEAHWKQYGPGATGVGWDLSFLGLALFIAAPDAFDREAAEAWTMGEDGKVLIRQCADAWATAHIANGADRDTALAMGKATGDFYTGA